MGDWYVRAPGVVSLSRGDTYVFVRPGAPPLEVPGVDVEALALLLARTALPAEAAALAELCEPDTLDLLVAEGVLRRGSAAELGVAGRGGATPRDLPCRRVVLGLTGAVGSLEAVRMMVTLATEVASVVDVILTRGACELVKPRALQYFGMRTWTDAFEPRDGARVPHIELASSADLVLVAPASASTLARLASGACSDLLSLVVAATRAPVVVAPAMNESMWDNPAITRNVARLRADGMWIVEPRAGYEVGQPGYPAMMGGMGVSHEEVARVVRLVLERQAAGPA